MESKKVLVLGGSGFIGSKITELSLRQNETTVIDIMEPSVKDSAMFVKGDVTQSKTFEKLKEKFDVIFDFASPSSMRLYDLSPISLPTDTVRGFLNILEYSRKTNVSNLIFPSSCTVYGNTAGDVKKAIDPLNVYASLKYFYESMGKVYSKFFKTTALRIFMGYGPGEEGKKQIGSPIFLFIDDIMNNRNPEIWGDGKQSRDVVYIDDIAEVAVKSINQDSSWKVFDVGTGISISFNDIISVISEVTGKDVKPKYVRPRASGYQNVTKADPSEFIGILGHDPIQAKRGIKLFFEHLTRHLK